MYESFEVHNFRGFRELSLESLSRVNLITGTNNVGKTALIEALFIHSGAYNPDPLMTVNALRGLESARLDFDQYEQSPWDVVFHNYQSTVPIRLIGEHSEGGWEVRLSHVVDPAEIAGLRLSTRTTFEKATAMSERVPAKILKLEYRRAKRPPQRYFLIISRDAKKEIQPVMPTPLFPSRFVLSRGREKVKEQAEKFAVVQQEGTKDSFVKALTLMEPRLVDVAVVMEAGEAMLHGDIGLPGRRYMPLAVMGDGVNRLATVLLWIASTPRGTLFIDEIEIGWHYSILSRVWAAILFAAKAYDVQLFCTTHSFECVGAAHEAMSVDSDYPLRVFRLEREDDKTRVITYTKDTLGLSLKEGLEVR